MSPPPLCARHLPVALLLALSLGAPAGGFGCSRGASTRPPSVPRVVLYPEGVEPARVEVELARTSAEQQRGLMYRQHLDDGRGMLFLFPEERQQTFWMRNTYVALDMIFIRGDLRVLGVVESAEPLTDTQRAVPGKSRYVLEVPAGYALRHRIGPGVRVDFIDIGGFSTTH